MRTPIIVVLFVFNCLPMVFGQSWCLSWLYLGFSILAIDFYQFCAVHQACRPRTVRFPAADSLSDWWRGARWDI